MNSRNEFAKTAHGFLTVRIEDVSRFLRRKTYQMLKSLARPSHMDSTLASLVPSDVTKLKALELWSLGAGVCLTSKVGTVKFTKPIRGGATESEQVTEPLNHWNIEATYKDFLTTDSRHSPFDSAGGLVPVFDSNARLRSTCDHATTSTGTEFDGAAKPLREKSPLLIQMCKHI